MDTTIACNAASCARLVCDITVSIFKGLYFDKTYEEVNPYNEEVRVQLKHDDDPKKTRVGELIKAY